ncbi:MAG: hypothetical protein R2875_03690 [Desulfobacterales bacterium]
MKYCVLPVAAGEAVDISVKSARHATGRRKLSLLTAATTVVPAFPGPLATPKPLLFEVMLRRIM